jgi:SAM-dependent methyltransferase
MSAFGQAMFDQLQRPNVDISFRMRFVDGQGQDCSCRDFLSLRPEEESLVRDCLADRQEPRILDIGCGIGRHSIFSRSLSPHVRVTVVEVDQQLRDHCISEVPGTVGYGQFDDVPADASFDAVFLLGGGLGIFGDERTTREQLQRLHSLVADGGCVLIESGNPFGNKFHAARHVIEYGDSEDGPFPWGYATREWLQRELAGVGFETVRIEPSSIGAPFFICHATKKALAPEPIAVDPSYLIRDCQFWYSDCSFADTIHDQPAITVRVEGLGVRVLTHAKLGVNGQPTTSFTLPSTEDVQWWKNHGQELVRVELLSVADEPPRSTQRPIEAKPILLPHAISKVAEPGRKPSPNLRESDFDGATLCIGLDMAWFGGTKGDDHSKYDFLASVIVGGESEEEPEPEFTRVSLGNGRDPAAELTLAAIRKILRKNSSVKRIVFALDAPIQARDRQLPERQPSLKKGEKGKIKRRACEDHLEAKRKAIDKQCGGSGGGWHPKIQAGAPLAPRVKCLLAGLTQLSFELWTPESRTAPKLAIECFPAEAIWAAKRLEGFREEMTAPCVKAYKNQNGSLNEEQVKKLVRDVLHGFEGLSGNPELWKRLVEKAIEWMLQDQAWQIEDGLYRSGKLLDDVVDTMICLVTSLSYTQQCAHVWFDPDHTDDGHIIGPGFEGDDPWVAASLA